MQEVAGSFADGSSKLAMLSRDKKGKEEKFNCKKVSDANRRIGKDKKVFVLANAGTASASVSSYRRDGLLRCAEL